MLIEDETTLRLFPPLRSRWGEKGRQVVVPISGYNAKRVLSGVINPKTGHRIASAAARGGKKEFRKFIDKVRACYRNRRIILLLDRNSSHLFLNHPATQEDLNVRALWLPKQWPELNSMDQIWKSLKSLIAANHQYADVDELAEYALKWLHSLSPLSAKRKAGLLSAKSWLRNVL
jgi:hypothetical protein